IYIMKHLKILLFSIALIFMVQLAQAQQKQYELLTVQVSYDNGGLFIFHNDKEMEYFKLPRILNNSNMQENGYLIQQKLQELYDGGWEIESQVGIVGLITYILKREK